MTEVRAKAESVPPSPTFADDLASLGSELRADRVLVPVLDAVAKALGESRGADVDPDLGFFEMGLDSVLAVALMEELGTRFGVTLEPTLTFEYPTPRALAGYVLDAISEPEPESASEPESEPQRASAPVEPADDATELSDDDLVSRLLDRIASSEALLDEAGRPS